MNATDIRPYYTKQALRKALREKMQQNGLDFITINEICQTAGVSRTTFYIYYKNKYELLIDYLYQSVFRQREVAAEDDLESYFLGLLAVIKRDDMIFRRLQAVTTTVELQQKVNKLFIEQLYSRFVSGIAYDSADVQDNLQIVYHCYGILHLIQWWHTKNYPLPMDKMARFLATQVSQTESYIGG